MAFREEQKMLNSWLVLPIVVLVAGVAWWGFVEQVVLGNQWGNNPGPDWVLWLMLVLFGIGFPVFFMSLRLIVEVHGDYLSIHFTPFTRRKIAFENIEDAKTRSYHPIREYGGWGVKGWSHRKMAYSVSGNQGVDLQLRDGTSVMIGSREPKRLERALEKAMEHGRRRA